jgi:hypothetical protein
MSVKMAILLNKLGLYVTHDGDRHKVIVKKKRTGGVITSDSHMWPGIFNCSKQNGNKSFIHPVDVHILINRPS